MDDVGETGVAAARFRGGAGGGVIGWMFTEQSLELRFGEMRAGKLRVFVHWDKLRTIFAAGWFGFVVLIVKNELKNYTIMYEYIAKQVLGICML